MPVRLKFAKLQKKLVAVEERCNNKSTETDVDTVDAVEIRLENQVKLTTVFITLRTTIISMIKVHGILIQRTRWKTVDLDTNGFAKKCIFSIPVTGILGFKPKIGILW